MNAQIRQFADRHDGLVTWTALRAAGLPRPTAARLIADLRRLHDGVYLTGRGRITSHQRGLAATLTAPGTVLSHASAAAAWGFRPSRGGVEVVTRPGTGGPKRVDGLLVCRSRRLAGDVTELDGIPITTAARTLIDLSPHLGPRQRAKAVREAIRLRRITALELRLAIARQSRRRGTIALDAVAAALEGLPIDRTRSDAEARSLEVLAAAGLELPRVNVEIAGVECDLSWLGPRYVLEVDGPQFHLHPTDDLRRQTIVERAGWTVERFPSDDVFDRPARLIETVRRRITRPEMPSVHGVSLGGTG